MLFTWIKIWNLKGIIAFCKHAIHMILDHDNVKVCACVNLKKHARTFRIVLRNCVLKRWNWFYFLHFTLIFEHNWAMFKSWTNIIKFVLKPCTIYTWFLSYLLNNNAYLIKIELQILSRKVFSCSFLIFLFILVLC